MMDHWVIGIAFFVCLFVEDTFRQSKPQLAVRLLALCGIISAVELVRLALEREAIFAVLYAIFFVVIVLRFPWRETMSHRN